MEISAGTRGLHNSRIFEGRDRSIHDDIQNNGNNATVRDSNFDHVKSYMNHEIETGKGQWIRTVNDYRERLGLSWEKLREMEELKLKIKAYDTDM